MTKLKCKVIKSNRIDYDYGFKVHKVYEFKHKWYVFREHIYNYVEYATEDEPRYEEASNDIICVTTWELVAQDVSCILECVDKYIKKIN